MALELEYNKITVDMNTLVPGGRLAKDATMHLSGKYIEIERMGVGKIWEGGAYSQGHNSFFSASMPIDEMTPFSLILK